jgi:hypothetical protein
MSVLILGSGPNVVEARNWKSHPFDRVVAINNAWQVREDWDDLIYPFDFPDEKKPNSVARTQNFITQEEFVPVQNQFGGFIYAGGTMAFTAAYWVLGHYNPAQIAFLGCDMHYSATAKTHFYGSGTADPLRDDISLMSLEAKASRFYVHAREQDCDVTNLSSEPSRLTFPRQKLHGALPKPLTIDTALKDQAMEKERALGYFVASGRYWEDAETFEKQEIIALDQLWYDAVGQPMQG